MAGVTHVSYMEGSPTYKALYERYGMSLNMARAEQIASEHGTTLEDLVCDTDMPFEANGHVKLIELLFSLGY